VTIALRLMTVWPIAALLACGTAASPSVEADQGHGSGREPDSRPTVAVSPADTASSLTLPESDVPWDDRDDYEEWQSPLPHGQDGWPAEPPSRWPDVRARLLLPPAVRPGETVDYVVVLRNVSHNLVDLRPCGGYRQQVMALGAGMAAVPVKGGDSSFRLNCDADPILLPAESRRYAMRVVVPGVVTGDEALFTWGFVDNMPDYEAQNWVRLSTN
jgi:hypothetical protein